MAKSNFLRLLTVGILSLSATATQAQTFTSADTPLGLPVGAPGTTLGSTISTITVADSITLGDLNVNLDYNHSHQGDLNATITSPGGTMVELFESNILHDLTAVDGGYLFDDEATDVFPGMIPAFPVGEVLPTGSYVPQNALTAFDGEDTAGVWTLTVNDVFGADSGTLNLWQLLVTAASDASGAGTLASMPIVEIQANSQFMGLLASRLRIDTTPRFSRPRRIPINTGTGRSLIRLGSNDVTPNQSDVPFGHSDLTIRAQGPTEQRSLWMAGYGAHGDVDGGFEYGFGGTAFGIQQVMGPQTLVGIAGNLYTSEGEGTAATADLHGIGFALYGNHRFGENAYFTTIVGYNFGSYASARQTTTGAARGDFDSHSLLTLIEVGQSHGYAGWTVRPHVGLQYQLIDLDGYRESAAAPSNLVAPAEQLDSFRGILGIDAVRSVPGPRGTLVSPRIRAGYIQEMADTSRVINPTFASGGAAFPVTGASLGDEFGDVGAGINLETLNGFTVFMDYDAQFTLQHFQHTGRGGLAINW